MSDNIQDHVDVRTINWKEDEASREGTQALRHLAQSLHDAQANPSLQPMVHALSGCEGSVSLSGRRGVPSYLEIRVGEKINEFKYVARKKTTTTQNFGEINSIKESS